VLVISGKGISEGVAVGRLLVAISGREQQTEHTCDKYEDKKNGIKQSKTINAEQEKCRVDKACEAAKVQFAELAEKCKKAAGEETAAIFDSYSLLIDDAGFRVCIYSILEKEECTAEYAVETAGEQLLEGFEKIEDEFIRSRGKDIAEIVRCVTCNLGAGDAGLMIPARKEPFILAARELGAAEMLQLETSKVQGIILEKGAANDHVAILARAMEIPAVIAVGVGFSELKSGDEVCLCGDDGVVVLEPDASALEEYKEKQEAWHQIKEKCKAVRGLENVSKDGRRIEISCNIDMPSEVAKVIENEGHGIGLFRSEFLYLSKSDWPSEEEQFRAYREVVAAMRGARCVIRTADLGADKVADYMCSGGAADRKTMSRGVAFSLEHREQFKMQLRAIYRASAYGKVSIMFPMISSVNEVTECRRLCEEIMEELRAEGVRFDKKMELGIMVETKQAVECIDELAAAADFFSIGTNDLTYALLGGDRFNNGDEVSGCDFYPAIVLETIRKVTEAAHKKGIRVCICGELAADETMLGTFLDMGIDELSVIPAKVLRLRARLVW